VASASSSGSGTANIAFGVLNSKNGFAGYINALRTEGLAKILAEPRVVTLSGKPAYIVSGGEAPVVLSNISGSSVTYKQFGTVVNFLPLVLGNGKIHLEVRPELSSINAGVSVTTGGTNPISAPGFDTRSAQVAVQMEDGQTLAIGGLIQNRVNSETRKVPIFGDLPFIGAAFRTVNMTESEEELLILVTPRLIDPLACNQLPKHLPGRETRTTDDFELFLEGIMEAPRGQRDVFPDGRYLPVHRNGETAAMYPCGDSPNPHIGKHRCRHCTNPNCSGVHTAPYSVSGNGHTAYRNPNGDSEAGIPAAGFPAPGTPVNILGPTSVPAPGSLPTSGAPGSFPPPPFGVSPGLGNRPPEGF
jgi:pilus assembly protein CpaC